MNDYRVFTRTWWKKNRNGKWPDGLEPHMGRKTTIGYTSTREEAVAMCKEWNDTHDPGRLSRKAEFEAE